MCFRLLLLARSVVDCRWLMSFKFCCVVCFLFGVLPVCASLFLCSSVFVYCLCLIGLRALCVLIMFMRFLHMVRT